MRYLPKSPAERVALLAEIGAASIDDLFAVIPEEYRLARDLDVRCETLLAWIYLRGIHELRLQVTGARPYRALVKVCDGRGELLHAAGVLAVGIGAVVAAMGLLVLVAG